MHINNVHVYILISHVAFHIWHVRLPDMGRELGARVRIWRISPLSDGMPAWLSGLEAVPSASHMMVQGPMHACRHGISSSWPVAAWTCSNVDLW